MDFAPKGPNKYGIIETIKRTKKLDLALALLFIILCGFSYFSAFIFSFKNYETCDKITLIEGVECTNKDGAYYIIGSLPRTTQFTYSSSLFIKIDTKSENFADQYLIDALFNTMNKTFDIRESIQTTNYGMSQLFTTSVQRVEPVVAQIYINGDISNITKAQLILIENTPEFFKSSLFIKKIVFSVMVVITLLYCVMAFIVRPKMRRTETLIILFSLVLGCIASYPIYNGYNEVSQSRYMFHVIIEGAFPAANLIALVCICYRFVSDDSIGAVLIISLLFVLSESMRSLTSDSFLLSDYFDGNDVFWIFFFTISIVSRVCLIALVFHHLSYAFIYSFADRISVLLHFFVAVFAVVPRIAQIMNLTMISHFNSSVDFFCESIAEPFTVICLAIIHWPNEEKPKKINIYRDDELADHDEFQLARTQSMHLFENVTSDSLSGH